MNFDPTIDTLQAMFDGILSLVPNLVIGGLVFLGVWFLARGLRGTVLGVLARYGSSQYASIILGRITQWITLSLGMLIVLSVMFPSINAETLIGVLGISSLAIGFAFRDIAQNFLAGVLILLTQPFKIGDQIDSD